MNKRRILRWITALVVIGVVAGRLAALALAPPAHSSGTTASQAAPVGPEGIAVQTGTPLAPASAAATGRPVDGIQCGASEQAGYHIHTHLAVYVDGVPRPVPAGVGIVSPIAEQTPDGPFDAATRCYYWLHVHAEDGVIHVESPTARTYTLGQFFAIWRQPLGPGRVGPARGTLTVFVNGREFHGNPAAIPLRFHEDIQLDAGAPVVPPQPVDWSGSGL